MPGEGAEVEAEVVSVGEGGRGKGGGMAEGVRLQAAGEARLPGHGPIITRMLRPRPEDRYRNGHDVMVDLRRQN